MGGAIISDDEWKEILEQCDLNNDGKISFDEFIHLLVNKEVLN